MRIIILQVSCIWQMKGTSRISLSVGKILKALLYVGVKSTVKHNQEYRLYHQKKEGGEKNSLLNYESS